MFLFFAHHPPIYLVSHKHLQPTCLFPTLIRAASSPDFLEESSFRRSASLFDPPGFAAYQEFSSLFPVAGIRNGLKCQTTPNSEYAN